MPPVSFLEAAYPLDTQTNALASILTRVLKPPPAPRLNTNDFVADFNIFLDTLNLEPIEPQSVGSWLKKYPLRQAIQIKKDYFDMGALPRARDLRVSAFTKVELLKPNDPRNISSRSYAYQAALGPYIGAFEAWLVEHVDWLVKHQTLDERNAALTLAYHEILPTHVVECDFSRFDSTVSLDMLRCEHLAYKRAYPNMPPLQQALLDAQLHTDGNHLRGVRYTTTGRRCSGDPNTSIGNALLNRYCHWRAWRGLPNWRAFHEGDDCIAFVNTNDIQLYCQALREAALDVGFRIDIIVHDDVLGSGFCGRRLYLQDGKIKCFCDFPRTISKIHGSVSPLARYANHRPGLLLAKAMSYVATDVDTPIIGPLCHALVRAGVGVKPIMTRDEKRRARQGPMEERIATGPQISAVQRDAFFAITGLSPATQTQLESQYKFDSLYALPTKFSTLVMLTDVDEILADSAKFFLAFCDDEHQRI